MISEDLPALERKITAELARRPEYFVNHPAELRVLKCLTSDELQDFAQQHSWRVISRVGGRQLQFYNDTFKRERASALGEERR